MRRFLWWLAQPIARFVNRELRGQDYGYAVLRLPRAPQVPPEAAEHRVVSQLERSASTAQIVASVDGMRSLMNGAEHVTLKASGDFVLVCCDCAHVHRLSYTPVVDDANELALDVHVRNDDTLTVKIRRDYDWPFQAIRRVGKNVRIIGGH